MSHQLKSQLHSSSIAFYFIALLLVALFFLGSPLAGTSNVKADNSVNTSYNVGVLVLKYFPLTSNGQNIDISVTGDIGGSYSTIRQKTIDMTAALKDGIENSTKYLGYQNSNATPSLNYSIVDDKEYTQAVPISGAHNIPSYPDYNGIMTGQNICDYVDNQNVREVWIWAYQGPNQSNGYPYLAISESKMSGPNGDISNSQRFNDMPICNHTYRVYTFNYDRGTAEALHSWGHQLEAEMGSVDVNLYSLFQGPVHPQTDNQTGRCGSVHNPPNSRQEYDYANTTAQASDCLDWDPNSLGTTTNISCSNWGCSDISDTNNSQLNYLIWMNQNLPGKNNLKTYKTQKLRNWWDVHGDFDTIKSSGAKLSFDQNTQNVFSDDFNRSASSSSMGGDWAISAGTWGISSTNSAYYSGSCNTSVGSYATMDTGLQDGVLQVKVPVNRTGARVVFRYVDANNFYWLEDTGVEVKINKRVSGTNTQLAAVYVEEDFTTTSDDITIKFFGPYIDAKIVNGGTATAEISAIDSSLATGTKQGLGIKSSTSFNCTSGDIRFDDFSVDKFKPIELPLYTNGVEFGFTDGSYGYSAKNACDTSLFASSTCSFAVTYTPWGALNFQVSNGNMSTFGFSDLIWKVYTNGQNLNNFSVLMSNTSSQRAGDEVILNSTYANNLGNGWYEVDIPLSSLNPNNDQIANIQLKNSLNSNLNEVHIDDVRLSSSPLTITPPPPPAVLDIYVNGVEQGFTDGSTGYSSRTVCDTSKYVSSTCSYAADFTPWGGLNFQVTDGSLSTTSYTTLQWKLYPNGQPISDFSILLTDADNNNSGINEIILSSSNATDIGSGWYRIDVPLSALNPSNKNIGTIQLKNAINSTLSTINIDDVKLLDSSPIKIYADGLVGDFTDNSYGYSAKNACDTSLFYAGACSYSMTYTAWGGINFFAAGNSVNTTDYQSLQWKLYPDGRPISDFSVLLTDASNNNSGINEVILSSSDATTLGNGWYQITMPVSTLNPNNKPIGTIQLKNALNNTLPAIHVDDVEFVK